MKKSSLMAVLMGLVSLLGLSNVHASSGRAEADWSFALTPYLWLPTISGQLNFTIPPGLGGKPVVDAGLNDYLENLDFAILLAGEARKGPWSLLGDFVYLDFAGSDAKTKSVELPGGGSVPVIDTGTETSLTGFLITFAPGYSLYGTPKAYLNLFAGVRYLSVEVGVDWQITGPVGDFPRDGSLKEKKKITDGIIGIRGSAKLGEGNWSIPYYLDVGTGDSDLSWQASAGVSYSFSWGDLRLAYRHLEYDLGSDHLLQDFSFSGPALGATFHF